MQKQMENEYCVKILIVEDDLSFALDLEILLTELDYYIVGRADNFNTALKLIQDEEPDLILMDIDLKGNLTGIDLANKIQSLSIPILFITSRIDESSFNLANESNLIGYLTKPIGKFTLRSSIMLAIQQAYTKLEKKNGLERLNTEDQIITKNCFFFKQGDVYKKVLTRDIAYVKSERNYCDVFTSSGKCFVARTPISKLKETLPKLFLRVHRQYIVNLHSIQSFSSKEDYLIINQKKIPVSKSSKKALMKSLNIFS